MSEFRYALRTLARTPGSSGLCVVILVFGVTAVISAFSVLRAVALDPLPFEAPDRLFEVRVQLSTFDFELRRVDDAVFEAWQTRFPDLTFAGSNEARHETTMYLSEADTPARVLGAFVSPGYFDALGVRSSQGRGFSAADIDARVAVITHRLWQTAFAGGDVLGRVIRINGEPHEVVGVLPSDFEAPRPVGAVDRADHLDVFVPLRPSTGAGEAYFDRVFVRLGPLHEPSSVAAFLSELHTPARSAVQAAQGAVAEIRLVPISEVVLGDSGPLVRILGLVVGMTLLLTFASLVVVQSARLGARRRDAAIRAALGASGGRLVVSGSLGGIVLSVIGAMGALLLVMWVHGGMQALLPPETPRLDSFRIDIPLALVALLVAVGLGLGASVLPAMGIARQALGRPRTVTGTATRTATGSVGEQRWSGALVAIQIALMFSLTVGLGLLARSVMHLYATGEEIRNLDTVVVDVHRRRALGTPVPYESFFSDVLSQLRSAPGVTDATMTSSVPFRPRDYFGPDVRRRVVDGAYFETVGMRLVRGRTFDVGDRAEGPPVAIIDQALADARFASRDPVGLQFDDGGAGRGPQVYTVVGVAEAARHAGLDEPPAPALYVPFSQNPDDRMSFLVRGPAEEGALVAAVREAVLAVDPMQPLGAAASLRELRARSEAVGQRRFLLWVLGAAGVLAALLASLAIYGTIAQAVAQRSREIGVRIAFGAGPARVVRLVLRGMLVPVGVGILLGLLGASALRGVLASTLFGVEPNDPAATGLAVLVVLLLGAAASLHPLHRALTVDPALTLKGDGWA